MQATVLVGTISALLIAGNLHAQQLRTRVVDKDTRQAIVGAELLIIKNDTLRTTIAQSSDSGFIDVVDLAPGNYSFEIRHPAYRSFFIQARVPSAGTTVLAAILMERGAFELDPIEVEAESRSEHQNASVGTALHVISGERLLQLENANASATSVLRALGAGLRVREARRRVCVESNRRIMSLRSNRCDMVVVVVDGVIIGNSPEFLKNLRIAEYESIEYLSPLQATRYGMDAGAYGAIVLWTRGSGPHRSQARTPDGWNVRSY